VVQADGPLCTCGNRGCVERLASGSGLAQEARALAASGALHIDGCEADLITAEDLGRAAAAGHADAGELIRRGGDALGTAIASVITVLNPERVVLAGPVLQLGETYLDAVRAAVAARAMRSGRESCEILVSRLADPALLGAAALVL
jgi:glucokinase